MAVWRECPMDSCRATLGQFASAASWYLGMGSSGHLADHGAGLGITHGCGWNITTVAHRGDHVASASCGGLTSQRTWDPSATTPPPWTD